MKNTFGAHELRGVSSGQLLNLLKHFRREINSLVLHTLSHLTYLSKQSLTFLYLVFAKSTLVFLGLLGHSLAL
jgi:hypothetical protein